MSDEDRRPPNLYRLANERETGDRAEDNLRRLARRIVASEKAQRDRPK